MSAYGSRPICWDIMWNKKDVKEISKDYVDFVLVPRPVQFFETLRSIVKTSWINAEKEKAVD